MRSEAAVVVVGGGGLALPRGDEFEVASDSEFAPIGKDLREQLLNEGGLYMRKDGDPAVTMGISLPWTRRKRWFTLSEYIRENQQRHDTTIINGEGGGGGGGGGEDGGEAPNQVLKKIATLSYHEVKSADGSRSRITHKGDIVITCSVAQNIVRKGRCIYVPEAAAISHDGVEVDNSEAIQTQTKTQTQTQTQTQQASAAPQQPVVGLEGSKKRRRTYILRCQTTDVARAFHALLLDVQNLRVVWRSWRIPMSELNRCKVLGKGAFGTVFKGTWTRQHVQSSSNHLVIKHVSPPPSSYHDSSSTAASSSSASLHDAIAAASTTVVSVAAADAATDAAASTATTTRVAVAIKTINAQSSELGSLAKSGFVKEGHCMRQMSHENIVRFYGAGFDAEGLPYLVTELADGGSLRGLLANKTQELPWLDRYRMAADAANGLTFLHSLGVAHRDIKSDNMLIFGPNRRLKISDFGTSRCSLADAAQPYITSATHDSIEHNRDNNNNESNNNNNNNNNNNSNMQDKHISNDSGDSGVGASGVGSSGGGGDSGDGTGGGSSHGRQFYTRSMTKLTGTPLWMAPEIFKTTHYGHSADIYSLGMTYFELANRTLPWAGEKGLGVFISKLEDAVCSGRRPQIHEDTPPAFKHLIETCWNGDLDARPTAVQVLSTITKFSEDE